VGEYWVFTHGVFDLSPAKIVLFFTKVLFFPTFCHVVSSFGGSCNGINLIFLQAFNILIMKRLLFSLMLVMACLWAWADNSVTVSYNGNTATVTVDDNVAQYLTVTQSGAHVSIVQGAVTDEITYTLTGTSSNGEFYMSGSYKATIELNGITLTNSTPVYSGAAVHIQNGKRINVKVINGTTNTLTDASSGSQKGCLYVKGHAEFKQQGTLNIVGNKSHGIKAGEYISVKNATINVTSAVDDGISCNQYFLMESGSINISGTGDDGIQCDLDGDTSTGMTVNHEDEDSGNIYVSGGNITINSDAIAAKGIKCQGDAYISGNAVINVTTTGKGEWDATEQETNSACGLSADGDINISGGTLVLTATGSGGKGMKCDNVLNISGGDITVSTTGGLYYNNGNGTENTNYTSNTDWIDNNYYSAPKGIKAGYKEESGNNTICYGGINISGGTIYVNTKGRNAEGIESKNYLNVTGGETTIDAYDDGINAAQDLYITGGYLYSRSSNNDGIDANGNVVIEDGLIYAIGAASPEVAIDANSEENKKFHFNGGILIAIGGLESGSTLAQTCYQASSVNSNTWYSMTYGGNVIAFLTPTVSSGGSGGGPGGGGPGGGGSSSGLVISAPSTPTLKSSVTVSNGTPVFYGPKSYLNATITGGSNVSLSQYSSGGGGSSGSYTVTASANPSGAGTVTGAGTYTAHSLCTLTATANTGYTFDNWTRNGSVASTDPTYSFYVTENSTCVAYFTQQVTSYTITATANPTNGGTVTGGGSYPSGSTATLKAIANTGYIFTNWTKDGSVVSTNASYSFTVSENASYVANFTVAPQYAITVTANPTVGGTVTGAGNYYQGTSVTLTATANTGYAFVNWTKNGAQVSTNATYTFTVTAAGSYVANFETVSSHSVTVVQTEGGTINANVSTAYPGEVITLTATANSGYFFSVWDVRDANSNNISVTDNQFVMPNSDVTVSASFVQGCNVTIAEVEHGTVTASATQGVPGTTITLTATPDADYFLSTWVVYQTGDVLNTVTVTNNSFVLPAYDVTVVAIFKMTEEAEITIGSGTNTSSNLPTNVWYKYTTSQQIYTQSEIGEAGTITAVSFQYNGNATSGSRTLDIYMTHTNSTTLSTWVAVTSASKVYTGTQTFTTAGWYTITLDTPFEYDGTSNIMVTVDDNTGSYIGSSGRAFYVYATGSTRAIYNQSDSYNVTPMSPQSGNYYTATTSTNNSQIKFTKVISGASELLLVSPNALGDFTYVEGEGPSAVQSVAVIGTDLTEEITVTAPADYEISDEENGTYGSTLTLTAESRGNRDAITYDFEDGWQGWTAIQGTTGNSPHNWMHSTEYSGYTSQGQIDLSAAGNNSSAGFMLSESYISATYSGGSAYGAVYPDNYLVSPQIQLGGSITFYAASRMSNYPAEKFSVLVSESGNTNVSDFTHTLLTVTLTSSTYNWNEYTVDLSNYSGMGYVAIRHYDCYDQHLLYVDDITIVEGDDPVTPTEPTVDLLTANVYIRLKGGLNIGTYANETLVVSTGNVTSNVSLSGEVTRPEQTKQTVALYGGWNWFSTYIDLDPVELLEMLQEGMGDSGLQIESVVDGLDMNVGEEWVGDLMSIGLMNEHMYMIEVSEAVTFELQGPAADPEVHPITIYPSDWSWIGYPCAEEVDINVALAGLDAEEGDMIETLFGEEGGMVFYDSENGVWVGDFDTMVPGRGYMYYSNSDQEKTLVIQTGAQASHVSAKKPFNKQKINANMAPKTSK
jgi:hypothetical protein